MGRILAALLVIVVGLAPLALGSNRPLPWSYNALLAGLIGLLCCGLLWSERHNRKPLRLDVIATPVILWAAALLWAAFQLVPLPGSSLAHPSWNLAGTALGEAVSGTITVNASGTLASLMRFMTYTVVFLSTFVLARDPERAGFIVRGLVVAAAIYAVYGLLRYATAIDKLLWFDQPSASYLTSTFINPNTAATYFGLATCVSFVLLLRQARHLVQEADAEGTARRGIEKLLSGLSGRFGLELALFVLLLTATLLTQSRAGVAAALLALFMGLLLNWLRQRRRGGGPAAITVVLIGLIAGFAVLQMSGARVFDRLAETETTTEGRFEVYADTATAILDHAWIGTGLGNFQDVFPIYRDATPASSEVWDKAHNDYLEILLGLGIPAGLAIIFGIGVLVFVCVFGVFERRRNSHMPMAGAMAGILVAFHAMFDFSLQVQAVALSFAVLLAVATAQSTSERSR